MFTNILVPVDLSDEKTWRKPVEYAIEMARQAGGTLHVMSVIPSFGSPLVGSYFPEGYEDEMLAHARQELQNFVDDRIPADIHAEAVVTIGNIYEEVLQAAERLGSDLIVMGRSSSTKTSFLLGPNAARVVRHARTAVLVAGD